MSYGPICGEKKGITLSKRSTAANGFRASTVGVEPVLEVSCGLYEGHAGKHIASLFEANNIDPRRIGEVGWWPLMPGPVSPPLPEHNREVS